MDWGNHLDLYVVVPVVEPVVVVTESECYLLIVCSTSKICSDSKRRPAQ